MPLSPCKQALIKVCLVALLYTAVQFDQRCICTWVISIRSKFEGFLYCDNISPCFNKSRLSLCKSLFVKQSSVSGIWSFALYPMLWMPFDFFHCLFLSRVFFFLLSFRWLLCSSSVDTVIANNMLNVKIIKLFKKVAYDKNIDIWWKQKCLICCFL